jgi:large subunit ribosomal protein L23
MSNIIIKPVVTEKMTTATEDLNRFGFIVDCNANKVQIKKAIEKLYGVTVTGVRTMNYAGKSKTRYTKTAVVSGRTPSYKKAIIQVAEGDTIDLYANI